MQFSLTISCDNAAFTDGPYPGDELARILHRRASDCRGLTAADLLADNGRALRDLNGNTVGHLTITAD